MTAAEQWRPIQGAPGYEVSDQGRVRSLDRLVDCKNGGQRRIQGRLLRPRGSGQFGYPAVTLSVLNVQTTRTIHRLVLAAFIGPCPEGMEALHGLGGHLDNRLVNLRWGTHTENIQDTVQRGLRPQQQRVTCPAGHLLAEPNLVKCQLPSRKCLACHRGNARVTYYRKAHGRFMDYQAVSDAYYSELMAKHSA